MKLILKIAYRNILRHKGKSLIIGTILFIGAFVMTLGNGIISGMDRGIEKNIIDGFLGNIVLIPEKCKSDNVLLDMGGGTLDPITTYAKIKPVLESQNYVERFLPVGKNMGFALNNEDVSPGFAYILGVDFEEYKKMFPDSIKAIEGRLPEPGEKFALVPMDARKEFYDFTHMWLIPEGGSLIKENMHKEAQKDDPADIRLSSSVILMGFSDKNSATDIRFPVKGVVRYKSLNMIFGHFTICDIESYRECLGYINTSDIEVPEEKQKMLSMDNTDIDSMFSQGSMFVENSKNISKFNETTAIKKELPQKQSSEYGSYNLIFVKLKDGVSEKKALKEINNAIAGKDLGVRAVSWHKAAGVIGGMTLLIKGALFVFVTLLFVVAIIIIVNTLTMAALERTSELGMMRAIGAKKGFIGLMFFGETGILSVIFGGAGIALGIIAVNVIPLMNITSSNDMLQLLYGGDTFSPVLRITDIIVTVIQLSFVTFFASAYPVSVARGITPLDAITKE